MSSLYPDADRFPVNWTLPDAADLGVSSLCWRA
jgi:hypothetical protein